MSAWVERFVDDGFLLFGATWSSLTVLSALGLIYLCANRYSFGFWHRYINRVIVVLMVTVLAFSALYIPASLYASSQDRGYAMSVYAFYVFMSAPFICSAIGVGLTLYAPYEVNPLAASADSALQVDHRPRE